MSCKECAHRAIEVERLRAAVEVVTTGAAAAAKNYRDRIHRLEVALAVRTATGKRTRTRRSGARPWAVAS